MPPQPFTWMATVRAPQGRRWGGPMFTHYFEGSDPSAVFREIADALDLTKADQVHVSMNRVYA